MGRREGPRLRVRALGRELDRQPRAWALQVGTRMGWKTLRAWKQDDDDPDYTWLYDAGDVIPRHEFSAAHLTALEALEALTAE